MSDAIKDLDPMNIMHATRIGKIWQSHTDRAQALTAKIKTEARKQKGQAVADKKKGIKVISKLISDPPAQPLLCVKRDRDNGEGAKQGAITTNPYEIDGVVKGAWKTIYDGVASNLQATVARFFSMHAYFMMIQTEHQVSEVTTEIVYDSFRHTPASAGALDGWRPRELAYFSIKACGILARLFNLIEEGAPWPSSTRAARVVFLEKAGATVGEVMSYRPLAITSPLYRAWATMRLRCMADWVGSWALPEMHAVVPEMGAVDAWRAALTEIDDYKISGTPYCG